MFAGKNENKELVKGYLNAYVCCCCCCKVLSNIFCKLIILFFNHMKMILFVQDSLPSVYSDTMLVTFMKEGMS